MSVQIAGFHHAGLMVTDVERAAAFYEGVLGLRPLPRPDFGFDGRWYDLGNNQQLHLMSDSQTPDHTWQSGFDRHIALNVPDIAEAERQLTRLGVEFARGSGRAGNVQLFLRDPDGNMIELRPGR
jgi:glyoxylase I family protein